MLRRRQDADSEPTVAAGPFGQAVAWAEVGADESGAVRFALRSGAGFPVAQPAAGGGDGSAPRLAEARGGALRLASVSTDAVGRGRALVATVDAGVISPAPTTVSGADNVTEVRLASIDMRSSCTATSRCRQCCCIGP